MVVGRPIASYQAGHHKFGIFGGLAVLSADALSSVAYATEEVLRVLMIGGLAAMTFSQPISVLIAILLIAVAFSFRQTIFAFPGGGGAYVVTRDNLGPTAGLAAAASLLIDYTLTVAVSITAGVSAVTSAFPSLHVGKTWLSLVFLALLTFGNLRGLKESARLFGVPVYAFLAVMLGLIVDRRRARDDRHRGAGRAGRSAADLQHRHDHDVHPADRVRERLHGADRRRGGGRRRADVQGTAGEECGAHAW